MRTLAAVVVASLAACAAEDSAPWTYGDGLGTPENPIPEDNVSYVVTSKIDFTQNGTTPPDVAATIAGCKSFAQNPARTLLQMADATAVQQLKSAIGTTLSNNLEGYINTEVDKARIATKTMRQFSTDVASITETSLTKFYLDSSLSMTPAKTTHVLTDLNFKPASVDLIVLIGGVAADKLTQTPTLAVAPAGAMTLGEQKFGLAFGDHAWSGVNLASTTIFGAGVQMTFQTGINCAALAKAVAARCSGSCVGHESELRAICDGGTAKLVGDLREHVAAFHLNLFRLASGTAKLLDENLDGLADRIVDGTWSVELDLGTGVRQATAAFTAAK
jgi:hypothetical protein